jgi:hypothetical protein
MQGCREEPTHPCLILIPPPVPVTHPSSAGRRQRDPATRMMLGLVYL